MMMCACFYIACFLCEVFGSSTVKLVSDSRLSLCSDFNSRLV